MPTKRPLLLIAALAALLGAAPLWPWLDLPLRLAVPIALLLGGYLDYRGIALLRARPATLLTIAGFLWYATQFSRAGIVAAASNLLAFLLALRLVTEKSGRNLLQLFILSLLCLAASSLYSLSSAFLAFLVLEVIAIAFGLVLLCHAEADPAGALDRPTLRGLFRVGLGLPLVALLMVPPLFFLLPRTQFPLWNALNQPQDSISGITDHVELGTVSALAQGRRVVLRVESPVQPDNELYWRVIVLNTPEGNAWIRRPPPAQELDLASGEQKVEQLLYIEPTGDRFLPGLDAVATWDGIRAARSADGLIVLPHPLEKRGMAKATSHSGGRLRSARPFSTDVYLTVPERVSPRLHAVIAERIRPTDDVLTRIAAIDAFFLDQQLIYSLSRLPKGADPLESFLFEEKSGYCEHFATAYTVMLRLAGVPARLVGGYYGGEYNEFGGYYAVSEDRAHLWVEALVDRHWERIDPTRLARNAESVGNIRPSWLHGFARWSDAFDFFWNRTIIGYDLTQQFDLLRRSGRAAQRWDVAATFRAGLRFVLLPAAALALVWVSLPWLRRPAEERLLRRFLRQLRKSGIATDDPTLGLLTLAGRHRHPAARLFAERYNAIVFADRRAKPEERRELRALLRQLRSDRRETDSAPPI